MDMSRPESSPSAGFRLLVVLAVVVGGLLRFAGAITSNPHPDEEHYVEDAMWAYGNFETVSRVEFLREHPRTHYRLSFQDGVVSEWPPPFEGRGRFGRIGHPTLQAWIWGALFWLHRPASLEAAIRCARIVNAGTDVVAIALIPALVGVLGGSVSAGVAGAWLYALFPPSIAYAGIANQDPLLAPLLAMLAIGVLRCTSLIGWSGIGVVTGSLAAAKQTGLLAFALVPLWALLRSDRKTLLPGLGVWLVAALLCTSLFVDPFAYLESILHPKFRMGAVGVAPWERGWMNLGYLLRVGEYWGLGFDLHGAPPEWLLARPHTVLTPGWLAAAGVTASLALWQRRLLEVFVVWLTVVLVLATLPPTDGMWRLHLLWPLICAGIACGFDRTRRLGRVTVVAAGVLAALVGFLPARLGADGGVPLGDLAFANPAVHIPYGVHRTGLSLNLPARATLSRSVVIAPGRYNVAADTTGPMMVRVDEESWVVLSSAPEEIEVVGWLHSIEVSTLESGGVLRSLRFSRR